MTQTFDLEESAILALRKISRAIDVHSRAQSQRYGLTGPQLFALREISRLGPVSAGDLSRAVHLSQATITGILTRLEKRNLVTRTRAPEDKRSVLVEVTAEGRKCVESVPSPLQDRLRIEFSKLHEWERTSLLSSLQRFAAMVGD